MIIVVFPTVEEMFKIGKLAKLIDKKTFSKDELIDAIAHDFCEFGSIATHSAISRLSELAMLVMENAAENGHAYFIKMMLDHWDNEKNDLHRVYTRYFGYAFSAALIHGDVDIARMIYGEKAELRNTIWIDSSYVTSGRTPLMLAKESGNKDLVALLEKAGIRVNSRPVATPLSPRFMFKAAPSDVKESVEQPLPPPSINSSLKKTP
jgi:hypothetical protein